MKIRIWKLGSLEHKITPTREGVNKLSDLLNEIEDKIKKGDEGPHNIIWGPDLTVTEINDDGINVFKVGKTAIIDEGNAKKFLEGKGYNVTKGGLFKGI